MYFLAFFTLVIHLLTSTRLGHYSDELYFIDCSKHLDFGYFDITPIVPFLIHLVRTLFGDSLMALRIFPALGHAGTVLLAGLIAKELGTKRFASILASVCVMIAPAYLRIGSVFVVPSLEPALWTLAIYIFILIAKFQREKLWLAFGAVAGLGIMTKPSVLLFGLGFTLGLVLTPERKFFSRKWIWLGGLITFIIVLPNLIWQATHNWVTFEFVQAVKSSSWVNSIDLSEFVFGQVLYMHPINFPVWFWGCVATLRNPRMKIYRALGWMYLIVLAVLIFQGSKLYYLLPLYVFFIAAGSVQLEKWIETRANAQSFGPRVAVLSIFTIAGLMMLPAGLPIFNMKQYDSFARVITLGLLTIDQAPEVFDMYRDMEGEDRKKMLEEVSRIYRLLPKAEAEKTSIFAYGYDQAGALNLFGKEYGLPEAISGNVSYFLWGAKGQTGDTTIAVGYDDSQLLKIFRQVIHVEGGPKLPYPIRLCRYPFQSLSQVWPTLKTYPYY